MPPTTIVIVEDLVFASLLEVNMGGRRWLVKGRAVQQWRRKFIFNFFHACPKTDLIQLTSPPPSPFQENRVSGRHVDWDVIVELIGTGREASGEVVAVWGGVCFCRCVVVRVRE